MKTGGFQMLTKETIKKVVNFIEDNADELRFAVTLLVSLISVGICLGLLMTSYSNF